MERYSTMSTLPAWIAFSSSWAFSSSEGGTVPRTMLVLASSVSVVAVFPSTRSRPKKSWRSMRKGIY